MALHWQPGKLFRALAGLVLAAWVAGSSGAWADTPASADLSLPNLDIVAPSPLMGSGVDRRKVPAQTSVIPAEAITRDGPPDALRALDRDVPGITLQDGAGNPFQPSLTYHGFQASPLAGNAQGLAVYLGSVRFNQAFGDTVNWDLIPAVAIDRIEVVGTNPVFGLNALGGAISTRLKTGFTYQGSEITLSGGSFGKMEGNYQYGAQSGDYAAYVAGTALRASGWRDLQSSSLGNIYGTVGWRDSRGEINFSVAAADSVLNGPGTAPVQLLNVNRAAQFTAPNLITNKYVLLSLSGAVNLTETTSLQAVTYDQYLLQRVRNGNAPDFEPCGGASPYLCTEAGTVLTDRKFQPIPDFLHGGPYSQLDRQTTDTNGYGVALQIANTDKLSDMGNHFVAGSSYDGAVSLFSGNSAAGGLRLNSRMFTGPGTVIAQADGTIAPVRVQLRNASYGLFFTDTLDITHDLALTVAGRLNSIQTGLDDQNGTSLNGQHAYTHFNPSAGLTYALQPGLSAYVSFAVANRAPTPAELSCADPDRPCSLANFFTGDPNLKQVVAQTLEAGLRGNATRADGLRLDWTAGLYRTDLDDDILFVGSAIPGRAYFRNIGTTRRQGADLALRLVTDRWSAAISYAYIDATFRSPFTESSANNPAASPDGTIQVRPGDRVPGIPSHLVKLNGSVNVTENWSVSASLILASGRYLIGDEANLTPKLAGYAVLNLSTQYRLAAHWELFGTIENLSNTKYATFGTFSPTTAVPIVQAPNATNPRSYSPAPPLGLFVGLRIGL